MNRPVNLSRQITASLMILAALMLAGFLLTKRAGSEPGEAASPKPNAIVVSEVGRKVTRLETAPACIEALAGDIRTTGQIEFPADRTVKISPRLQGRIRQVFVHVGDRVAAGQTLALLDSTDAAAAQNNARQAENKRRLAASNLQRQERLYRLGTPDATQAQANLAQAKARTQFTQAALARVQEQAKIGGFTEKPVEDAQTALVGANSDLAQAQSDLAQAERDHARKVKLVEIGIAAKSDLEAADNVLEKARVTVQADQEKVTPAKQALDREKKAYRTHLYADQQVRSAESDYRQAQLQEEAADRALRLAKTAVLRDLQQAQSDDEAAQADAENARRVLALLGNPTAEGVVSVVSPIAGIVTERSVSPGQVVDQSQMTPWQMFTISDARTVWVDADVYEKDIAAVTPGKPVQIRVDALPNREFAGRVLRIAPMLDPKTHAVNVRAEIDNRDGLLKDGMYAEVTIRLDKSRRALMIPLSAVQREADSDFVFVAEGKQYVRRQVQLGAQRDGQCVVVKGLREGEQVVTHGGMFLGEKAGDG